MYKQRQLNFKQTNTLRYLTWICDMTISELSIDESCGLIFMHNGDRYNLYKPFGCPYMGPLKLKKNGQLIMAISDGYGTIGDKRHIFLSSESYHDPIATDL